MSYETLNPEFEGSNRPAGKIVMLVNVNKYDYGRYRRYMLAASTRVSKAIFHLGEIGQSLEKFERLYRRIERNRYYMDCLQNELYEMAGF